MKRIYPVLLICVCAYTLPAQQIKNATWITNSFTKDTVRCPPVVFQKLFESERKIRSATLYVTALGIYEATLNGKKIGNAYFAPGFTSYDHRLQYQAYDITKQIKPSNVLHVTVADGWYRGPFGGDLANKNYGEHAGLLAAIRITYTNGDIQVINTDTTWHCGTGPVRYAEFYDGEWQDTRITATKWQPTQSLEHAKDILTPQESEPVIAHEHLKPVKILNNNIIDFGQNIAGTVRINIKANAGDTISIEHAETLDNNGNFFTGNLREAKATDTYIANGTAQTLEPRFTYHGFRYIKVTGVKTPLNKKDFTAVALYTDIKPAGTFTCSDPMLNKLQSNITWSLKSNFVDIPTDCPQRSERLGWTGDAQIFFPTAAYNYDVKKFFTKWMRDLAADMGVDGSVPRVIPDNYTHADTGSRGGVAGWSDAATIIPWKLFEQYDDTTLLREQYPIMKKWVDYVISVSPSYQWKARGYGDWYAPGPKTNVQFINQCYFGYSLQLLIKAATTLNDAAALDHYISILDTVKNHFISSFVDEDGRLSENTQTAYALALQFNLLPDSLQQKAASHLAALVRKNNNHLATGFLGTPYLLEILTKYGYTDLAYTVLMQKTMPSWLYPVTKGATTIWEKWDAIREDGSFDTCSLNHYAYGAVGNFLYQYVAGIQPLEPGYKKILIAPNVGRGLSFAKVAYKTGYGIVQSEWSIRNHQLSMKVTIPPGTTGEIRVPNDLSGNSFVEHQVKSGTYVYTVKM